MARRRNACELFLIPVPALCPSVSSPFTIAHHDTYLFPGPLFSPHCLLGFAWDWWSRPAQHAIGAGTLQSAVCGPCRAQSVKKHVITPPFLPSFYPISQHINLITTSLQSGLLTRRLSLSPLHQSLPSKDPFTPAFAQLRLTHALAYCLLEYAYAIASASMCIDTCFLQGILQACSYVDPFRGKPGTP